MSDAPPPRQTLSYLRGVFEQRGIHPKAKLGQSFLIDLNLLELIVRAADLTAQDLVLEIGTGTGSLTGLLASAARAVLSVEIDPAFHALALEVHGERPNIRLLKADVLKNKNQFNPNVLTQLEDLRREVGSVGYKLVANLPYVVATPVITNLLLSDYLPERMVVTVQWEIAERLTSLPGSKDYGALAVLVQSVADVELVRKLPANVFWPRPQVESAIVQITPSPSKRRDVGDVPRLRRFLRDLYTHRRKNLRSALAHRADVRLDKAEVDLRLARLGIDGARRAEQLTIEQHQRLCGAFG